MPTDPAAPRALVEGDPRERIVHWLQQAQHFIAEPEEVGEIDALLAALVESAVSVSVSQQIDNGNIYLFCDAVNHGNQGCVRGAGHNGPHAFCLPPYPQQPVILQAASVSVSDPPPVCSVCQQQWRTCTCAFNRASVPSPAPPHEILRVLIARWECVAANCREIAAEAFPPERAAALFAAAVNRDECAKELREALLASPAASHQDEPEPDTLDKWRTAAFAKDRTRAAIRERLKAGEPAQEVADDYGVPLAFVTHLAQWQLFGYDPQEASAASAYVEVRSSACRAGSDGDCVDADCPQLREGEPANSGRNCPLLKVAASSAEALAFIVNRSIDFVPPASAASASPEPRITSTQLPNGSVFVGLDVPQAASASPTPRWHTCERCGQPLPLDQRPALYDPSGDTERLCACGHPYYRHFDGYDDMRPIGCKYCECATFVALPSSPDASRQEKNEEDFARGGTTGDPQAVVPHRNEGDT